MTDLSFTKLKDRGVIRVSGPEAQHFLQNLITADVDDIDRTGAGYGALLTPQGKILFDFLILKNGDAYLLDTPIKTLPDLAKRLTFYKLRAKVDIETPGDETGVVAVWGAAPSADTPGIQAEDPRLPALGHRILGPVEDIRSALLSAGADEKGADDYAEHRIAQAVPEAPADYAYSDIFPHDADMDQLGGVSFSKGCYVGQEVVSRVHHRGTARKRFIAVSSAAPLPEGGSPIEVGGKSIGTLGSSAATGDQYRGLALIRLDKAGAAIKNGTPIVCGTDEVTLNIPDWADFGWPENGADDD
jgi:folate-binding protein YgfZ